MIKKRKMSRSFAVAMILLILLSTLSVLCACDSDKGGVKYEKLEDFEGKTVGYITGGTFDTIVDSAIDNVNYKTYNDMPGEIAALNKGDVDALAADMPVAKLLVAQHPEFVIFPEPVADDQYGFILQKNSPYTEDFTKYIKELEADGTTDALKEKWFSGDEEKMKIDWSQYKLEGRANGTLRYRYENTLVPMGYSGNNGEPAGFEVELLLNIADRMDMGVDMLPTQFSALINNLESDKADVCSGCISITEERKKSVDFPVTHYVGGGYLICRREDVASTRIFDEKEDFSGEKIGIVQGSSLGRLIGEVVDGIEFKEYDDIAAQIAALERGDVAGLAMDMPIAQHVTAQQSGLGVFNETLVDDSYGYILNKDSEYTDRFTSVIEEFYSDGTIDALKEKWFSGDEERLVIDWNSYNTGSRAGGTLRCAYVNTKIPMSFEGSDGKACGYETELLLKIADKLDMGVEFTPTNFGSLINYVTSEKADVGFGGVSITDERRETVDFPTSHYVGGAVIVCKQIDLVGENETEKDGFFSGLLSSFEKTFLRESRWKLILSGLLTTLAIAVFAGLFGTLLGFLLCLLLRSKNKVVSLLARAWCKLVQGIPSLVVLMIIYFVIFASSSLSPTIIGIISFAIMFGVSVAGILNTGINSVDKGQWEAAAALGFTKSTSFVRIILPPTIKQMLPIYVGEFVAMLKLTSIVGYISIEDLTKASDIIRSRTYEAFFPLITTAIIYFAIAALITFVFSRVEKAIDPRHRPRRLPRGVCEVNADTSSDEPKERGKAEEVLIKVEHLKKVYPNATPLRDVNTEIKRGEVITIIGPSGTGKSTLMRCINRLEAPTSGKIEVFGENVCDKKTDLSNIRRKMGMVFQSFNLFGHLTVIENVMLAPMLVNKQSKQEAYEEAMRLLKTVGMAEKALNYPDELSGGQKQRVAIVRTLAMHPDIVLLDEPTSALDPTMVGEVLSVIRRLADEGYTMLIVTHEMKFARDVSTRIFYMDEGIIYEDGTPEQIFNSPQRDKTRAFVNRLKVLPFTISSPDYDFIAMSEALQNFGEKNMLSRKKTEGLRRAFEEICAANIVPSRAGEFVLNISTEYSEDSGRLEMRFAWGGDRYDPMKDGDELSVMLISAYLESNEYTYDEESKENRLTAVIK